MAGEADAPAVHTVESLIRIAHEQPIAEFEQLLGKAVLIGPPATRGGSPDEWSFNTASLSLTLDNPDGDSPMVGFRESLVYPIRKARPGPFSDTILIGRATSNDICLKDSRLSKLHARIHLKDDGTMLVTEAGSKNGTSLNGNELGPKDAPELKPGDDLSLGGVGMKVHATLVLHNLLRRLKVRRG